MIDAMLPIVTPQKAIDLQVATNISERQSIEVLKHLRIRPQGAHLEVLWARKELFFGFWTRPNSLMISA